MSEESIAYDEHATGWIDSPEAVAAVAESLPFVFADTEAGQVVDLPEQVFLWELARKVTGGLLPARNQGQVGSCVAFGTVRAIEYTMVAEIASGQPEEFLELATEVVYAGSRVEVGRGKLASGDGSIGAWAATFVRDWGVLNRGIFGSVDLRQYLPTRCRQWGKSGVPDELEPIAKLHPVKQITRVQTWLEAKKALASGYGISLCSDQGFTMERNNRGVAGAKGRWAHCMCLSGYGVIDGKEHGRIDNSWGPFAHTGPTGLGNPGPEGFWAEAKVLEYMLGKGDCWIFSNVDGFPVKRIDWVI
jgi:hypothetical protein